MKNNAFRPGKTWLDTDRNRIHAHGGSVFAHNEKFFWVGENKEKSVSEREIWHWGVRLYSSEDLYNWQSEGIVLPAETEDLTSPLHYKSKMDRPHILYNGRTGQFVMWMKIMGDNDFYFTVAVSDKVAGPYRIAVPYYHPYGMQVGDFDLYKNERGQGFLIFERVHSDMIVAELSADYLSVTERYSVHFPRPFPPYVREAPAVFKRGGLFYMFTSGTTAKYPNPSEAACSMSLHGPWRELGDPHIGDGRHTSFDSQISGVIKHPKKDLYIAIADRWLTDLPENLPDMRAAFEGIFNPEKKALLTNEQIESFTSRGTMNAEYVWLPVIFENDKPTLRWYDEWRIDDFC